MTKEITKVVLEDLRTLESLSGKNAKLEFLRDAIVNANEEYKTTWFNTLIYLTSVYEISGISKKKISKKVKYVYTDLHSMNDLYNYLKVNNTGRDEDIQVVLSTINKLVSSPEDISTFTKLISKELKIGAGASIINLAYPNLIPTFDVMLAEKYYGNEKHLINKQITVTTKLDGNRCMIFNDTNSTYALSRSGKTIDGIDDILNYIRNNFPLNYVYDGEIMATRVDGESTEELYRRTSSAVSSGNKDSIPMTFHVFDSVSISDIASGESIKPYSTRKAFIRGLAFDNQLTKLVDIWYEGIYSSEKIEELMLFAAKAGMEGLMINVDNAPYQLKRTKDLLKVKLFNTADLRITGWFEGEGALTNTLGGLEVEFYSPTGVLSKSRVGSGFTLEDRHYLWSIKETLLSKIVEVQYFEITQNQNGEYGLRFPVYLRMRDDKTEISMN